MWLWHNLENCFEDMKQQELRGEGLSQGASARLRCSSLPSTLTRIPLPLHRTRSQTMTSDLSGTDSTFTAAFVLTAYADMKMALSIL